jgi:hypothetical protein
MSDTTWKGRAEFERNLDVLFESLLPAAGEALHEEAEAIMAVSQPRVPVDEGILRASGTVGDIEYGGGSGPGRASNGRFTAGGNLVQVRLGYGGPAEEYAARQHEELEWSHTVGEAKYLEKPMMEAMPGMEGRIGLRVRRELERKLG